MRILKAVTAVAAAMLLVPAAAYADTASDAAEAASWKMPDLIEENLDDAYEALQEAASGAEFELHAENINGVRQEVTSYPFWKVCWQAPKAGTTVTEGTWIGVGVTRAHTDCW